MLCKAAGIAWMYSCWAPYWADVAPAVCVPAKLNGGGVPEWNDCFSYDWNMKERNGHNHVLRMTQLAENGGWGVETVAPQKLTMTYIDFIQRNVTLAIHWRGDIRSSTTWWWICDILTFRLLAANTSSWICTLVVVLCGLAQRVIAGWTVATVVRGLWKLSTRWCVGCCHLLLELTIELRLVEANWKWNGV